MKLFWSPVFLPALHLCLLGFWLREAATIIAFASPAFVSGMRWLFQHHHLRLNPGFFRLKIDRCFSLFFAHLPLDLTLRSFSLLLSSFFTFKLILINKGDLFSCRNLEAVGSIVGVWLSFYEILICQSRLSISRARLWWWCSVVVPLRWLRWKTIIGYLDACFLRCLSTEHVVDD